MKKVLLSTILLSFNFIFSQSPEQTYVPDDNFEQALIDQGYDDVLDDYVLTANINSLTRLEINRKNVEDLTGISDFIALTNLDMEYNLLTAIDISKLTSLDFLNLGSNSITSVDLSNNPNLKFLGLSHNQVKNIDLSSNPNLQSIELNNNMLHNLDVTDNSELRFLNVRENSLETLDFSKNSKLLSMNGEQNQLLLVNLKNRQNPFSSLILTENQPNLCIEVDNLNIPDTDTWIKDDSARYSLNCNAIDTDNDGISDELDQCPATPSGQNVNAQGCSLSQYADIAVRNVSIGLGSFLCSEPQNCTVDIAVNRDVAIAVSVIKDDTETVFDGIVGINSPLALENLTAGQYRVCATRTDIPNFVQCYDVSSTETENSITTTIVMQNPGQTYTLMVEGNKTYEVLVNGTSTVYEFDDVTKQNLDIPLEVGPNTIQVIGTIECDDIDPVEDTVAAMEEDEIEDSLMLFPTLSDGLITLENNKHHAIHGISISSLNGVETKFMPIANNPKEIEIDMRGKAKGMYIVRIQRASGEVNLMKIVIQ